ncbi:hypothetical protein BKA69DRAFT_1036190 [Paraphysoderma sedebokerense]|nr:hypothetical protein BKA69DRAFT_1036190 [Paraphysoderma sedebokerense]
MTLYKIVSPFDKEKWGKIKKYIAKKLFNQITSSKLDKFARDMNFGFKQQLVTDIGDGTIPDYEKLVELAKGAPLTDAEDSIIEDAEVEMDPDDTIITEADEFESDTGSARASPIPNQLALDGNSESTPSTLRHLLNNHPKSPSLPPVEPSPQTTRDGSNPNQQGANISSLRMLLNETEPNHTPNPPDYSISSPENNLPYESNGTSSSRPHEFAVPALPQDKEKDAPSSVPRKRKALFVDDEDIDIELNEPLVLRVTGSDLAKRSSTPKRQLISNPSYMVNGSSHNGATRVLPTVNDSEPLLPSTILNNLTDVHSISLAMTSLQQSFEYRIATTSLDNRAMLQALRDDVNREMRMLKDKVESVKEQVDELVYTFRNMTEMMSRVGHNHNNNQMS